MRTADRGKLIAILCLIAVAIGWGSIPIFLRYFTHYVDVWTANGVRYPVGALFWLPFVVVLSRRVRLQGQPGPGRSVWRDAVVPSVMNVFGQTGYAASPYFLPASTVGFVVRLSFLFTVVLGFVLLADERPLARRPVFWVGAATSLGGLVLMFLDKAQAGAGEHVVGLVLLVATTAAWGGYAVSVRKWMAGYPARLSFGVISLYTSGALLLLMLAFGRVRALGDLSATLWACLIGSALIGVAFGHVLYYRAIHRLGPVVSAGVLLITPFVTCLGAAATLGERMAGVQLLGGVSVLAGGALLLRAQAQIERDGTRGARAGHPS